jgi:hypothetical protein
VAGNPLEVVTKFSSDISGLQKGANDAKDAIGGISPAALLTGATIVGAAGLAVSAIASMTQAAIEDEAQQAKVEQAYKGAGAAVGDYTGQINSAIEAGQAKGFTDTQTREALTSLITATGDAGQANKDLAAAQDIARFAGVDLSTAADAVAKAHAGQDGALRKLLPGLDKGKTSMDTLAAATTLAAGSSDAYAQTTEGSMAIASDAFGELGETLGTAFIPLVKAILPPLIAVIKLLGQLIEAILPPLSILFTALGVVIGKLFELWTAEYTIIGKVIGLLVTGLKPILGTLAGLFGGVGDAIAGVVGWIQKLLDWIGKVVDAAGKLLDSLNPLKGFSLPSLPFGLTAPAPAGVGASTRSGGRAAVGGSVVVNVYGGDPRRVTSAVREAFRRWQFTDGGSAPDRDW